MSRIGGAWYELSVNAEKFKAGLAEAETQAAQSSENISGDLGKIDDSAEAAAGSAGALASVLGSVATVAIGSIVQGFTILSEEMERAAKTQREMAEMLDRIRAQRQGDTIARSIGEDPKFNEERVKAEREYRDRVKKLNSDRVTDEGVYKRALEERDAKLAEIADRQERADRKRQDNIQREQNLYEQAMADRGGSMAQKLENDALSREQQINNEYRERLELADRIAETTGYDITAEQLRTAALQDRNRRLQDLEDEAQKKRDSASERMVKEQERILKDNTKLMMDAFKEFGKYVDKLERIQESWNDGFDGLGGADIKDVVRILKNMEPSIRNL